MRVLHKRKSSAVLIATATLLLVAACGRDRQPSSAPPSTTTAGSSVTATTPAVDPNVLPGMPPVSDPHNVYSDAGANMLSPAVAADRPLVYVPHNESGEVWVIDQHTFEVVGKYKLGGELQHVLPSWDMRTLYATDDTGT